MHRCKRDLVFSVKSTHCCSLLHACDDFLLTRKRVQNHDGFYQSWERLLKEVTLMDVHNWI
uniref:Uncharacterized protein n=1 Tax=Arundo donax TaxID=35708 RepID=A0A0A8ZL53_ARUDO